MDHIELLEIETNESDFRDAMEEYLGSFAYSITQKKSARGVPMLDVSHSDKNGMAHSLLVKCDNNSKKVKICKFNLASRIFLTGGLTDEIHLALQHLASENDGDYVAIRNDVPLAIIKGNTRQCEICLKDLNTQKIINGGNMEELEDIPISYSSFTIKKTIKEWLSENPDIVKALSGKPMTDQLNGIAKILMQKKINGDLNFDEFLDLFRQCCIMGANDITVLKFYQILKI